MDTETLNSKLYQKMFAEQVAFVQQLKDLPPAEILNHAYEYSIREDILLSLEYNDLSSKQAQALLRMEQPLQAVFNAWENHESHHMEEMWDMVESCADQKARQNKDKNTLAR